MFVEKRVKKRPKAPKEQNIFGVAPMGLNQMPTAVSYKHAAPSGA